MTWEDTLRTWVKPPTEHDDAKRDKTESQIKEALSASTRLEKVNYRVYVQGSYANNTNVQLDCDMDIAVECTEFYYYGLNSSASDTKQIMNMHPRTCNGGYDLMAFKADIEAALVHYYGRNAIIRGNTALRISEDSTTLPADVVPCCAYRLVTETNQLDGLRGTVLRPDRGSDIINWPQQQLENGQREEQGHKPPIQGHSPSIEVSEEPTH